MVKGISRQVIVVHSPDPQLFEQAIFILKDKAVEQGITDEALLQEAQKAINTIGVGKKRKLWLYGPVWACGGAVAASMVWLAGMLL